MKPTNKKVRAVHALIPKELKVPESVVQEVLETFWEKEEVREWEELTLALFVTFVLAKAVSHLVEVVEEELKKYPTSSTQEHMELIHKSMGMHSLN